VNYERNKKGARFFETQCSILVQSEGSYNEITISSLRRLLH